MGEADPAPAGRRPVIDAGRAGGGAEPRYDNRSDMPEEAAPSRKSLTACLQARRTLSYQKQEPMARALILPDAREPIKHVPAFPKRRVKLELTAVERPTVEAGVTAGPPRVVRNRFGVLDAAQRQQVLEQTWARVVMPALSALECSGGEAGAEVAPI